MCWADFRIVLFFVSLVGMFACSFTSFQIFSGECKCANKAATLTHFALGTIFFVDALVFASFVLVDMLSFIFPMAL